MSTAIPEEPRSKKRRLSNDTETKNTYSANGAENNEKETGIKVKSHKKACPKFCLKTNGEAASVLTPADQRVPLMLTDIQHLLLHSLLGNLNLSQPPSWYVLDRCNNISQTVCLVIEGISYQHWEKYQKRLLNISKTFDDFVEILTPSVYDGSLVKELALVPLSEVEKESIIQKYGSMNLALQVRKDLMVMMKAVFPIGDDCPENIDPNTEDKFPRTQLLLSASQLLEENYPVPVKGKLKILYSDYVMSKEEYKAVSSKSPLFGLDCEMCITNAGSELTRISLVNEKHETVYESFVKPYNHITDYLTKYSGITKTILQDVTKRLEDVQNDLRKLLPPDAILVGHSLNLDLHALKMMHPYIIDTSSIYNFTGERTRKPKLKVLAREFLKENIQCGKNGHCSVEDALASLKLVQLKLSKNIEFGDAVHTNRQKYKENVMKVATKPQYALSIFNHIIEQKKTSLVIGCDDITGDYHTYLTEAKESLSSQLKKAKSKKVKLSTVDNVEEVISSIQDAANVYNFVMAHLKVDLNSENEYDQMLMTDGWVKSIWSGLKQSTLCVILFGGTKNDNGIAMMKVKSAL